MHSYQKFSFSGLGVDNLPGTLKNPFIYDKFSTKAQLRADQTWTSFFFLW